MAEVEVQAPPQPEPAPAVPDYLSDPDAVLKDLSAKWRYGRPPDYSKTRAMFAETKKMNHTAGSLPELVQNLVKNWEVEASFKPNLSDWRTIDPDNYSFAINGGPPQAAEHMLKVGTYNAIIAPNEYYSPEHSDFATSHKTFKRMMPVFAWEVLEVYSGPPQVAFRWRHWGTMKNDYVGYNNKGEKVTAKAHGGPIDIEGVTVATVDDSVRLRKVETWFDPMDMFRKIAPDGVVLKQPASVAKEDPEKQEDEATSREMATGAAAPAQTKTPVEMTVSAGIILEDEKETSNNDDNATHDKNDENETLPTAGTVDILSTDMKIPPEDVVEKNRFTTDEDGKSSTEVAAAKGEEQPQSSKSRRSSSDLSTWTEVTHDASAEGSAATSKDAATNTAAEQPQAEPASASTAAEQAESATMPAKDNVEAGEETKPNPHGAAAASPHAEGSQNVYEEMSQMTPMGCPFLNGQGR